MHYPFFTNTDPFVMQGLALLPKILNSIMPMNAAQKRDLPYACKDLSEDLTSDREALNRPYWSSPRLTSAYMHYFLPWNILRLTRLFPALNFGKNPAEPLIVDLGSGPLTLPIALWLSRKDLRQKPVTFVCADIAPQPLNVGKNLFEALRKELDPKSTWKVHTLRTPLFKALKEVRGNPWLITMGNVLNESDEKKGHPIQKQIENILKDAKNILREDGKIFAVEPGTRQGARVLSLMRHSATQIIAPEVNDTDFDDFDDDNYYDEGYQKSDFPDYEADDDAYYNESEEVAEAPFVVLAPCPHNETCPLANHLANASQKRKYLSAWCHFNSPAEYVPAHLRQLSKRAGMDKDSISLSFLYLALKKEGERIMRAETKQYGDMQDKARLISDAFPVPRFKGRARYACHEIGLLLLVDSARLENASLCDIILPKPITRDLKSNAALAIAIPDYKDVSPYLEDYESYEHNYTQKNTTQKDSHEPKQKTMKQHTRNTKNTSSKDKPTRSKTKQEFKKTLKKV